MYNILKTDYNGTTSIVQNITVTSSDIAIGLGKRVYYILDPPNSQILKFNKSNNVLVGNITTFSNPLDMIVARGKNAICYLTHAVKVPSAAKLYIGIRSYFSSRRTLYTKLRLKCRNSHQHLWEKMSISISDLLQLNFSLLISSYILCIMLSGLYFCYSSRFMLFNAMRFKCLL